MKISDGELRRIRLGPSEDDDDEGLFLLRVFFTATDPEAVIARVREVLGCVLEQVNSWPADEEWPKILPSWFVERFTPAVEPSAPEPIFDPAARAAAWLQMWQSTTPVEETAPDKADETEEAQEAGEADEAPGSLSDWLFHFDPSKEEGGGDRSWWWWDAGIDALGAGWIDVATPRLPFGTEALYRLIEASGGANPGY